MMTVEQYNKRCEAMRNFRKDIAEYEEYAKGNHENLKRDEHGWIVFNNKKISNSFITYTAYYVVKHFAYKMDLVDNEIVDSYLKKVFDDAYIWRQSWYGTFGTFKMRVGEIVAMYAKDLVPEK